MQRIPKALLLLYVLLGYVIAQFSWWAYLIYDLNVDLVNAESRVLHPNQSQVVDRASEIQGKLWMILGEGSVFLSLLLVGAFYIRKFILREQRLSRQERNFMLATTHEFNSPIAAIRLNLQTLLKRDMERQQQDQVVQSALSANHRLEALVSNILMASRLDAGKLELVKEEFSIEKLAARLKSRYSTLLRQSECNLNLKIDNNSSLYGDSAAVETILGNLIENAIKYAPGSEIEMSASEHDDEVSITVSDNGPGVNDSEKQNIFKKFYRAENEETRSQKGSGLGLFLVKQLCDLHGAELSMSDNRPHGLIFKMAFKKAK